ncbi:MAG TPA: tetratricopeptide repeat protein [Burkholderiaceae bacterium]|nr:tetratricopeptide repeat protein [Burkholderiaceae bacterium]
MLLAACLGALASACAPDPAQREYLAALKGEESGMTREQQIAHLDRAIALAPRRPEYHETRAIYRIDLQQWAPARADLDADIRLADRPYARYLRGLVACEVGLFQAAIADFDTAIAGDSKNAQFYRGRALAKATAGDASGALRDADRLLALAPAMAESHYARGVALLALGRDREAVPEFDAALRIRPELAYVFEARALAHERLDQAELAAADHAAFVAATEKQRNCAPCRDPYRY